ncbi:MAG: hypothetical protein ACXAC5_04060 [Promethearchaeota archaeon]|jgi:hypothetical protein
MGMTITEALAEIKTINKKLTKKREFVLAHAVRDDKLKDPLVKDGGSEKVLGEERQSIRDLEARVVRLRSAINRSNQETSLTIGGDTRTISDWLIWKREVMPTYQRFLVQMNTRIQNERESLIYSKRNSVGEENDADLVVNLDEKALGSEAENLEEILGGLDGQLSLLNATVMVEVE